MKNKAGRILIINLKKCNRECPHREEGETDYGHGCYQSPDYCNLWCKNIEKLEEDGFPIFCKLEKVVKND